MTWLIRHFPALRDETTQVLVFVVVPLIVFLVVVVADLVKGQRISAEAGRRITFRPSLAIRSVYAVGIVALIGNLLRLDSKSYVMVVAQLLMIAEIARSYPGIVTLDEDGIRWRLGWKRAAMRWEEVYAFVLGGSGLSRELRIYSVDGKRLALDKSYYTGFELLVVESRLRLKANNVAADNPEPQSIIDVLHKLFLIANAAVIILSFGRLRF